MTATRYDPFKDETLGEPRKRKSPIRIDWRDIARRLAEGEQPRAIAASLGLAEDRIWRHLSRSLHFQAELQRAADRQQLLARLTFGAAGQAAARARLVAAEAMADDTALRLAERTGLVRGDEQADEPAEPLAAQLGAAAWRPLRRRKPVRERNEHRPSAAEIAEHAEWLAAAAEFEAARTQPEAPGTIRSNPEQSGSVGNAPEASGSIRSDAEAFRPAPRPPAPPPRPPGRTIVDLDGPDLARLKESGALPP